MKIRLAARLRRTSWEAYQSPDPLAHLGIGLPGQGIGKEQKEIRGNKGGWWGKAERGKEGNGEGRGIDRNEKFLFQALNNWHTHPHGGDYVGMSNDSKSK